MSLNAQDVTVIKVPARNGLLWVTRAWKLLKANPIHIHVAVFLMFVGLMLSSSIPILGMILPPILMPALYTGVMSVIRASQQNAVNGESSKEKIKLLDLMLEPFRQTETLKRLMVLGLMYGLCVLGVIGISMLIDDGFALKHLLMGEKLENTEENKQQLLGSILVLLPMYAVVSLLFWFTPLLVAWHGHSVTKAIFFSWLGCIRNFGAFLVYGAACLMLLIALSLGVAGLSALLGVPQLGVVIMMSLTLLLTVLLYCSFYASYESLIAPRIGE